MEKVGKSTFDIHSRLFDHRPFLNGEIHKFLKEFEHKRGDPDLAILVKDQEVLVELNAAPTESIQKTLSCDLKSLLQSVNACTSEIASVDSTKKGEVAVSESFLEKQRALRQEEWGNILEESTAQMSTLDNLIKEKELSYRQYYESLEEQLKAK